MLVRMTNDLENWAVQRIFLIHRVHLISRLGRLLDTHVCLAVISIDHRTLYVLVLRLLPLTCPMVLTTVMH